MKKILFLGGLAIFLISCSVEDTTDFYFEFVPVNAVLDVPENFVVNRADTLQVSYFRKTTCHSFNGFEVTKTDSIREVVVVNLVQDDGSCDALETDLRIAPIVFKPETAGTAVLKFYQGTDEDENEVFLTLEVPIEEE